MRLPAGRFYSETPVLMFMLTISAILASCGIATVLTKRNAIGILIGVELILNAANINLVAFNRYAHGVSGGGPAFDGQVFAVFVIVLAAAEAAIALAIFLNFYNHFATVDVDKGSELKG